MYACMDTSCGTPYIFCMSKTKYLNKNNQDPTNYIKKNKSQSPFGFESNYITGHNFASIKIMLLRTEEFKNMCPSLVLPHYE